MALDKVRLNGVLNGRINAMGVNGGSSGGGGVLKLVEGETTWQQVYDALAAGTPVVVPYAEDGTHVYCDYVYAAIATAENYGVFLVGANLSTDDPNYIAGTPNGVLIYNEGD